MSPSQVSTKRGSRSRIVNTCSDPCFQNVGTFWQPRHEKKVRVASAETILEMTRLITRIITFYILVLGFHCGVFFFPPMGPTYNFFFFSGLFVRRCPEIGSLRLQGGLCNLLWNRRTGCETGARTWGCHMLQLTFLVYFFGGSVQVYLGPMKCPCDWPSLSIVKPKTMELVLKVLKCTISRMTFHDFSPQNMVYKDVWRIFGQGLFPLNKHRHLQEITAGRNCP